MSWTSRKSPSSSSGAMNLRGDWKNSETRVTKETLAHAESQCQRDFRSRKWYLLILCLFKVLQITSSLNLIFCNLNGSKWQYKYYWNVSHIRNLTFLHCKLTQNWKLIMKNGVIFNKSCDFKYIWKNISKFSRFKFILHLNILIIKKIVHKRRRNILVNLEMMKNS